MVISVEDRAAPLLELLWIREAYALRPHGDDLPPLLSDTPRVDPVDQPPAPTLQEWENAWPLLWVAAARHAGRESDPALHERLRQTVNGSRERLDALQEIVGPTWRDQFGPDALDRPSHRDWDQVDFEAKIAARRISFEDSPLRRDVDAVVRAWRAGMTKIVTIPCRGEHTRRVGDNALMITENTMASREAFRHALETFG
ncbi:hypothetical protein Q9R08_00095 [Microbacterium sp. QXD-8]|uniref:Uncharacterized protein n=1 Tax=Microbacterium psychrotolerans TaxID=3068321 RepID=A0ABU0YX67_9MICO|nr:hypothetical protein [Microbacterium sp. QXD-8]MDQ7876363.1 hypothetical protein [Microbacterium sp. QXD-8]